MIRSFADRNTRRFFEGRRVAAFQGFAIQAERRLTLLDSAASLEDLAALPSNPLEALRGDRAGQYSIRINTQWRICFPWTDDGPCDEECREQLAEVLEEWILFRVYKNLPLPAIDGIELTIKEVA